MENTWIITPEINPEIFSMVILSLPLIHEVHLLVCGESVCTSSR